jgi:hypothetical protein
LIASYPSSCPPLSPHLSSIPNPFSSHPSLPLSTPSPPTHSIMGNVAHDLKTPLHSIMAEIDYLRDTVEAARLNVRRLQMAADAQEGGGETGRRSLGSGSGSCGGGSGRSPLLLTQVGRCGCGCDCGSGSGSGCDCDCDCDCDCVCVCVCDCVSALVSLQCEHLSHRSCAAAQKHKYIHMRTSHLSPLLLS